MLVEEQYTNASEGYHCGDSGLYEPYTDDIKTLFYSYMREYGRCISKVYIDTSEGVKAIGWVFQKRTKYEDCNKTYLQETWVTLHKEKPTKTIEYHYWYLH